MVSLNDFEGVPEFPSGLTYFEFHELLFRAAAGNSACELREVLVGLSATHIAALLRTLDEELAAMFEQAELIGKKIAILRNAAEKRR